MPIRFVGATIGRPLQFTGISDEKPMISRYQIYGLTIIRRATNGRPYRINEKFLVFYREIFCQIGVFKYTAQFYSCSTA